MRDKRAYGARAKGSERDPALVQRAAGLHQVIDDYDVLITRVAVLHTHDAAITVAHLAADDDGETGKRFKLVSERVLEALRRAVVRKCHAVDIRAHELGDQQRDRSLQRANRGAVEIEPARGARMVSRAARVRARRRRARLAHRFWSVCRS